MPDQTEVQPEAPQPSVPTPPQDSKPPKKPKFGLRRMFLAGGFVVLCSAAVYVFATAPTPSNLTKPVPTPSAIAGGQPSPSPSPTTGGNKDHTVTLSCTAGEQGTFTFNPDTGIKSLKCVTPPVGIWEYLGALLPQILIMGGLLGFLFWMNRSQMKGIMGKKQRTAAVVPDERFTDVQGVDDAKKVMMRIVDMLGNPAKYTRLGAKLPKGVLFEGPPGTGKTMLAKAVAGEAKVHFYAIAASELVEMFVGVGASRVRDLFETAKTNAPSIIFIDEIDAIGQKRSNGRGMGGHSEQEQTLNQILTEMDGFSPLTNVIVIAATNRKELLDPAILRPGRFDVHAEFFRPDRPGREAIFKVHSSKVVLAGDVDLHQLAVDTPNMTGADIANIVNQAAIKAGGDGSPAVTMKHLEDSIADAQMGLAKESHKYAPEVAERVAYHEAGHVLTALYAPTPIKISRVSIVGRGESGGVTVFEMPETILWNESDLTARMVTSFGGRGAEKLIYNNLSTGAQSDLLQATGIAEQKVTKYGMSDYGPVAFPESDGFIQPYSDQTRHQIDEFVRADCKAQEIVADKILLDHQSELIAVTQALLTEETLSGKAVNEIIAGVQASKKLQDELGLDELVA